MILIENINLKSTDVTNENVDSIMLLADEFCLQELTSECLSVQESLIPESAFRKIFAQAERQTAMILELKEMVASCGHEIEIIVSSLLKKSIDVFHVSNTFHRQGSKALEGIIAHLTRKYGGNVHDKGIVTIRAKSVHDDSKSPVAVVADLTSGDIFWSKDEPGQWMCWDFHDMRIRPTHYTIKSQWLRSWVVESSLDGENWTKIGDEWGNEDLKETPWTASYRVSKSTECRFIRLTQTGKSHDDDDALAIHGLELFGSLIESTE